MAALTGSDITTFGSKEYGRNINRGGPINGVVIRRGSTVLLKMKGSQDSGV